MAARWVRHSAEVVVCLGPMHPDMAEAHHQPAPPAAPRLPAWLRRPFDGGRSRREVRALLRELHLHTVCESARCPNLCECWKQRAATFLLLGDKCTRTCRFCAVAHGVPAVPDLEEAAHVVEAVRRLSLRFAVLTCVTRDDLPDGGAAHIAGVIAALRRDAPGVGVEALVSDCGGRLEAVDEVLAAGPDVFSHNLETTARLTPQIRPRADYRRSLRVLARAAALVGLGRSPARVKSGFMLGLGETAAEIRQTLRELRESGVTWVTLGQYLAPTAAHWPVARYVTPEEFCEWEQAALNEFGFATVVSGPLVRSSYHAADGFGSSTSAGNPKEMAR